jgi:Family of unknown function (DUF6335)
LIFLILFNLDMSYPKLNSLTDADSQDDTEDEAYRAEVNGDEAVGGSTAVPSQNDTEELAEAAGIVVDDDTPLDTGEMLEERDRDRWELDPASAVDR